MFPQKIKNSFFVHVVRNFLLFAGFIIIGLLILEFYFRISYPASNETSRFVADSILGWDSANAIRQLEQGGSDQNIVFIGDSFTHDTQWPEYLRTMGIDRDYLFNGYVLGVSGYGTLQSVLKLKRHIKELDPDVIVLLIYAWNDFRDNLLYPKVAYNYERSWRPYGVVNSGNFNIQYPERSRLMPLLNKSEVYKRLIGPIPLASNANTMMRDVDYFTRERISGFVHYAHEAAWIPFYRVSDQETLYVQEAYEVMENTLRLLKEVTTGHDAQLLVVGIDNAFSVDEDVFEKWLASKEDIDVSLPMVKLKDITSRLSISYVDATEALRSSSGFLKLYNGPKGNLSAHLEPEGEQILATSILDALLKP